MQETRIEHLQNPAINIVELLCSVICYPVELFLRPWAGSRSTPSAVVFFSSAMMLFLPLVGAVVSSFTHMVPFMSTPPPVGMFDLGDFAKVYFLGCTYHMARKWYLLRHMEKELVSRFEGRPLPFFYLLPNARSFYLTRIVYEPAFVVVLSVVLQDLLIAQSNLVTYLRFAALALFMKNYIVRSRAIDFIRDLLDARNSAPIVNKLIDNQATDEELAPIQLASFPKNIPSDIREAAVQQLARAYSPDNPIR